jgi:hypothetical protein
MRTSLQRCASLIRRRMHQPLVSFLRLWALTDVASRPSSGKRPWQTFVTTTTTAARHYDRRSAAERTGRRRHRASDDRPGIAVGKPPILGWDASNVRGVSTQAARLSGELTSAYSVARPHHPHRPNRAKPQPRNANNRKRVVVIRPSAILLSVFDTLPTLNSPDWPVASRL